MALMPAQVVAAPEPRGLRYGLLTAAAFGPIELPAPFARGGGLTYEPVSCGAAHVYPIECDTSPPSKTIDTADAYVTAEPFLVYSAYRCSSVGKSTTDMEDIARRRLGNGEQAAAEAALGDVLAANATPIGSDDMTSLTAVVSELEHWLYVTEGYGHVGVLHAPVRVAAYAQMGGGLVVQRPTGAASPTLLTTAMGTVWVFGAYPDTDTIWISGNVTVWRADDIAVPPAGQTFDRASNQWTILAEREYAVAYDCLAASTAYNPGEVS